MPIRLLTLGGLRSVVDGGELDWLASQWLRAAVLVYLTIERTATRDALLALFWPENDGDTAGHRLSQTVYTLRRALGEHAIETRGRELRAGPDLQADALDFDRALADRRLEDAIALYRGPFLDGVHLAPTHGFEAWTETRRAYYARQFRKTCRSLIDAHLAASDLTAAITAAHAWVAPDPFDDEAQHRLIELLAKAGNRSEALRHYEAYTHVLSAEGLEPLDQTRELIATIERQTGHILLPLDLPADRASPAAVPASRPETPLTRASETEAYAPPPAAFARSRPRATRGRALRRIGATLIGSIVLALVLWRFTTGPPSATADDLLATPEPIAVLIFQDLENDPGWLAVGITSSLIDALNVAPLKTRGLTAVTPYRNRTLSQDSLARLLDVDLLIDGVIHRDADAIRVRAEVIDLTTGDLRAVEVRREPGRELELTGDVVREVTRELENSLRPRLGRAIDIRRWSVETDSSEAFRLVHRATELILARDAVVTAGRWQEGLDMLRAAVPLLEAAMIADPVWPEPRLQRATIARHIAYTAYANHLAQDSVRVAIRSGLDAIEPLFDLRAPPARAYEMRGALGFASLLLIDGDSAQRNARRLQVEADLTTAADADRPQANSLLSSMRFLEGELDEAARLAERALLLDAYLEDAREILNRLFTIRFEQAEDEKARPWCDEIARRYEGAWDHAHCALDLMAWDPRSEPDIDRAWQLARTAASNLSDAYSGLGQEVQLALQVAAVIARVHPDSARSVMRRALRDASLQGQSLGNFRQVLDVERAGVHMLLAEPDSARNILDRYDMPVSLKEGRRFGSLYR